MNFLQFNKQTSYCIADIIQLLCCGDEAICGVVGHDGKVTLKDAVILARHLSGWDGYGTLPYKP